MAIDGTWKRNGPFKAAKLSSHDGHGKKKKKGNPCQGHGIWEMRNEVFLRCCWKNVIKGGSECLVFKPHWPPSLQPVHMYLTVHPQPTYFHSEVAGSIFLQNTGCKYKTMCCHNPEDCNMNSHFHKSLSAVCQEVDVLPPSRTMLFKSLLSLCGGGSMETCMMLYLFMYMSIVVEDELHCLKRLRGKRYCGSYLLICMLCIPNIATYFYLRGLH